MTATTIALSGASIHKEAVVEAHLVAQLVARLGYEERTPADYDRALALDKGILLRFLRQTQPAEWQKLEKQYAASAEAEFFKQVDKNLKLFGTLHLLRHGMKLVPGIDFDFCVFQPASGINPDLVRRYEANVLSVIRQVRYSQKNENAIDVVLFVNGFPVATLELKNTLTGQNVRHAEHQYRHDRSPAGEPLLTFKRGALVHFALDQDLVSMTTRLQNSATRAYYELEKAIDSDPTFKTNTARRQVARFAHLHPTAIAQKVEVIVEHFRRHVLPELDGQAKGMVVTGSRESAMRAFLGMKEYIKHQGYPDIRPLVAFSGELTLDGEVWTEALANGFSESQLTKQFDETEEYRLLVVAEKYQTGFDQPKLCAMYVDRQLAGLQAVQTLSRLNRTAPGKTTTYILDFQNTIEEIQEAFKPYFEVSELEATSDPNQIYALQSRLMTLGVLDEREIDSFASLYYQADLTTYDRTKLEGIINQAVARFKTLEEDEKQEEFRQLLKSYLRFYAFVAQIVRLDDPALEKLSAYGEWLIRLLPTRELPADIEITDDMIRLHAFKIAKQEEGDASLTAGDSTKLRGIEEFAAKPYTVEEEESLSEIIKTFNERHGTEFTAADLLRFEQVNREILDDEMVEMLRNNPPDVVYSAFSEAFFRGAITLFQRDAEMKSIVLTDAQAREHAIRHFFNRAIRAVRA